MHDDAAFLAKIIEAPDEDAPRLVYADWLQEHGREEQARFVRGLVATSHLPGTFWNLAGRGGRVTRFKDLLGVVPWELPNVRAAAMEERTGYVQASSTSAAVLWRRGFIEAVFCSGVSLGPVLKTLKRHPLREVVLTNEPNIGVIQRLYPDWPYSNLFAGEDRENRLLKLLRGGFPNLIHARFESGPLSRSFCPFELCVTAAGTG